MSAIGLAYQAPELRSTGSKEFFRAPTSAASRPIRAFPTAPLERLASTDEDGLESVEADPLVALVPRNRLDCQ